MKRLSTLSIALALLCAGGCDESYVGVASAPKRTIGRIFFNDAGKSGATVLASIDGDGGDYRTIPCDSCWIGSSPRDGKMVVIEGDTRIVHIADTDGSNAVEVKERLRREIVGKRAILSPTGTHLCYVNGKEAFLHLAGMDGTIIQRPILLNWEQPVHPPLFSPDGRRIALFSREQSSASPVGTLLIFDIVNYRFSIVDENAIIPLAGSLDWSSDGDHLIYARATAQGAEIVRTDIHDRSSETITTTGQMPTGIALSPDGGTLAIATMSESQKRAEIRLVDLTSGEITTAVDLNGDAIHSPQWSPDGSGLLFLLMKGKAWGELHVYDHVAEKSWRVIDGALNGYWAH